uniref:trypsin n=1 Tax=Amphilophus citrinellus TaxID=61819 RepID=A0A3Q0RF01_AMPCI
MFLLLLQVKPSDNEDKANVTEPVPVLETKSPTSPTPTSPTPTSPTPTSPTPTSPTPTSPTLLATTKTPKKPESDEFLESFTCGYTRASCDVAFCPPWERCFEGRCICKLPYLCPTEILNPVCGHNNRTYRSYCQVMALSCRTKKSLMSHFGENCGENLQKFRSSIDEQTGLVRLFIPNSSGLEELLVCKKFWNMAAANVELCKFTLVKGAASKDSVEYRSLGTLRQLPEKCVSVYCQGYEMSLAECIIYDKVTIGSNNGNKNVATATCYQTSIAPAGCPFTCANGKCVTLNQACNGIDDCGDRSDEMCCKKCKKNAFRCKTGVCVYKDALRDGQIDCLDGEDETEKAVFLQSKEQNAFAPTQFLEKQEIRAILESKLYCGIPNATTVDHEEAGDRGRTSHGRAKRVVGGVPAKPTQIQWQVALEENRRIDCGGAYIGGCWVITAAHCVRPNPGAFRVKFSLWKKIRAQGTTDIVPVEDIYIHPNYIASTYQNDIAVIKLKKLPFTDKCLLDNPAISAVCVPWSTQLFQPNHTCSISGWGRTAEGKSASVLLWANVSLIENCSQFYGDRFKPGMMCAGDLEGSVDSCQGDSGGPLVCKDELGVSYLWGIVSWGERCGQPGFPGVYTQVAHYFEWIRLQTGWPAVTKFNS